MEVLKAFPGALAAIEKVRQELCISDGLISSNLLSGVGGNSGELHRLTLTDSSGDEKLTLVVKVVPNTDAKRSLSRALGLAREALFFKMFASDLFAFIGLPKVMYSEGDMALGEKVIVMEDLKNVTQSGYFFGPGSPLNHGKDLEALCKAAGNPSCKEVAALTFRAAAELHAHFWQDGSLSSKSWLRGSQWVQGEGAEDWWKSQQTIIDYWTKFREQREKGEASVVWPEDLFAVVDASVRKISWDNYLSARRPWTLVHGDFHPANMMWHNQWSGNSDDAHRVVFLDWEVVGLGSGPQELGQYFISHMDPATRRECEEELVRGYYDRLVSCVHGGKACQYTWEECWSEYKAGGVGRWMWFMAYFAGNGPSFLTEYFIQQVGAFVRDHGITPDTIGQPRA